MKKLSLMGISILSLTMALAVSSFAWYQLQQELGKVWLDAHTQTGLNILFSQVGDVDEAMMPAKLKKGVVSGNPDKALGHIDDNLYAPRGINCLPLVDENYEYVLENSEFVARSEYLDYPASIVYNQFALSSVSENIGFSFKVRYYNVDQDEDTDVDDLHILTQTDALTFNFFVLTEALSDAELESISTVKNDITTKKTVEKLMSEKAASGLVLKNDTSLSDTSLTCDQVNNYRYTCSSSSSTGTYSFDVLNLTVNQTYYLIVESYYSLPDVLIDGNLPLTGKFSLDIAYQTK